VSEDIHLRKPIEKRALPRSLNYCYARDANHGSFSTWADENLRQAGMGECTTEEQERIELARDLANIDYSDDELDSESDTDKDNKDDFPYLYDILFLSRIPTDNDNDNDSSLLLSLTITPPGTWNQASR